jgi:hypothetical protein
VSDAVHIDAQRVNKLTRWSTRDDWMLGVDLRHLALCNGPAKLGRNFRGISDLLRQLLQRQPDRHFSPSPHRVVPPSEGERQIVHQGSVWLGPCHFVEPLAVFASLTIWFHRKLLDRANGTGLESEKRQNAGLPRAQTAIQLQ